MTKHDNSYIVAMTVTLGLIIYSIMKIGKTTSDINKKTIPFGVRG